MKIYKIDKSYLLLLVFLLFSSIVFLISHTQVKSYDIKFVLIGFLILFILFNLVNLLNKRVIIDSENIEIRSLFGSKKLRFFDIEDIAPVKLKGRYLFILSDSEKYGFLSSMFENFDEIFNILKENAQNEEIKNRLSHFSRKDFLSKKRLFVSFLIVANIFLLAASIYNFITFWFYISKLKIFLFYLCQNLIHFISIISKYF